MFERFTEQARTAVVAAQEEARELQHGYIGTEHLLLGLLGDADSVAARALGALGVERAWLREEVERTVGRGEGLDAEALATLGIDLAEVRRRVEAAFGVGALDRAGHRRERCRRGGRSEGHFMPFSPRSKRALELALREAVARRDGHIGAEHVLLGIAREPDGVAGRVLRARGLEPEDVRAAVATELARRRATG